MSVLADNLTMSVIAGSIKSERDDPFRESADGESEEETFNRDAFISNLEGQTMLKSRSERIDPRQQAGRCKPAANSKPAGKMQQRTVQGMPKHPHVLVSKPASRTRTHPNMINTAFSQPLGGNFGDDERRVIQALKEKASSSSNAMCKEDELHSIIALAKVFQRSAISTLNYNNLIRAAGLYNYCLVSSELNEDIHEALADFEGLAMRKILKLKSSQVDKWFSARHLIVETMRSDLITTRDLFHADLKALLSSTSDFPPPQVMLNTDAWIIEQMCIDEKILALYSIMQAEVSSEISQIVSDAWENIASILGPPPCKYALISIESTASEDISPYEPISVALILEKDSPALKGYFKNAVAILCMTILAVGETTLASLNVRNLAWYCEGSKSQEESGFSFKNITDEGEKQERPLIELMKTPQQLLAMAGGQKVTERNMAAKYCMNSNFICGAGSLWKDLSAVRQKLLQREEADRNFQQVMYAELREVIQTAEPFSRITMKEVDQTEKMEGLVNFSDHFLKAIFRFERHFSSESTVNRLEEMMSSTKGLMYPEFKVTTQLKVSQKGIMTTTTQLSDVDCEGKLNRVSESTSLSRELKQINAVMEHPSEDFFSQSGEADNSHVRNDEIDNRQVLRKLKKNNRVPPKKYNEYYRGYMKTNNGEAVGYVHPLHRSGMNLFYEDPLPATLINIPRENPNNMTTTLPKRLAPPHDHFKRIQSKTSDRTADSVSLRQPKTKVNALELVKNPKVSTPVETIVRITSAPVFKGKNLATFTPQTGQNLLLLHSLSHVVKFCCRKRMDTKLTSMMKEYEDVIYLRMLQITIPLIDQLRPVLGMNGTVSSLKKALEKLDLIPHDDELAVAVFHYHNQAYEEAAQAVYKYIENNSDITFCGEPFPDDLIEVCKELLEDKIISKPRYQSLLSLAAYTHIKRNNFRDCLVLWNEVQQTTKSKSRIAEANDNIAQCCLRLDMVEEGIHAADAALEFYKCDLSFSSNIERLNVLKHQLQLKSSKRQHGKF